MSRIIFILSVLTLLLAALWFGLMPHLSPNNGTIPQIKTATVINNNKAFSEFTLKSTLGNKFTERSLLGHWTVLFFGYTDCPDICPMTLATLKSIWQQFAAKKSVPARFVFASINPGQDDVNKLAKFLHTYNENFIGVTGTPAEINKFSSQLGIFANEKDGVIDHSASILLINPKGHLAAIFSPPFNIDNVANDLLLLAR